jgi:HD-GYP domain-containing protein (c-di-GMP phosphodiesterase class II)
MNSAPPSDAPSPGADAAASAAEVKLHGAPLIQALEEHLPGSAEHGTATGAYALAAAAGMGMGRGSAELCRETAKIHDIGKIYVEPAILEQPPDQLGSTQRVALAAHYPTGARLALGAGIPGDVCIWILQVRENFDGSGPDGLAGAQIPIVSRIVRAACACHTLLLAAERSGRTEAASVRASVILSLRDMAGAELDPEVVEALAESLGAPS